MARPLKYLGGEMALFRLRLIVALVVACSLGSSIAAFAAPAHSVCVLAQHDCDETPSIAECCCGDGSALPSAPPEARTQLAPTMTVASAVDCDLVQALAPPAGATAVSTISPRTSLLDLPTLFSTLLI